MSTAGSAGEATERAPKRRREVTRPLLLDAAFRAIATHGYAAASVEIICAEAGFTRGAFYSNFLSKDELGLALYRLRVDRVLEKLRAHSATPGPAPDLATSLLATMANADEYAFKAGFELAALRNQALLRDVRTIDEEVVAAIAGLVVQMAATSKLKLNADPALPARSLIALFRGLAAETLLTGAPLPDEHVARALVGAVIGTYTGRRPSSAE